MINQPHPPLPTLAVSVELFKAFDTVTHTKLVKALICSPLGSNTIRWLSAYLGGRMAGCRYKLSSSSLRHTRSGVSQGSCGSPALFNYLVSSYPQSVPLTSSYDDGFTNYRGEGRHTYCRVSGLRRTFASQSQLPNLLLLFVYRVHANQTFILLSLSITLSSRSSVTLAHLESHSIPTSHFSNSSPTLSPEPSPASISSNSCWHHMGPT